SLSHGTPRSSRHISLTWSTPPRPRRAWRRASSGLRPSAIRSLVCSSRWNRSSFSRSSSYRRRRNRRLHHMTQRLLQIPEDQTAGVGQPLPAGDLGGDRIWLASAFLPPTSTYKASCVEVQGIFSEPNGGRRRDWV